MFFALAPTEIGLLIALAAIPVALLWGRKKGKQAYQAAMTAAEARGEARAGATASQSVSVAVTASGRDSHHEGDNGATHQRADHEHDRPDEFDQLDHVDVGAIEHAASRPLGGGRTLGPHRGAVDSGHPAGRVRRSGEVVEFARLVERTEARQAVDRLSAAGIDTDEALAVVRSTRTTSHGPDRCDTPWACPVCSPNLDHLNGRGPGG